jgi:uroporphyrinogen decarboxylase
VLWGGIDEQGYLAKGTPEEVSRKVETLVQEMNQDGGYVAAPSHNIQEDVPCENVLALYATLKGMRFA